MSLTNWFAALEQSGGIMKRLAASLISIDETDEQGRVSRPRMKLLEDLKILRDKTRFENQILRRIAGDGQFRRQNQLRARSGEALISADNLFKIAAQIPYGRVNLSKTDLHPALEQIIRNTAGSNPLLSKLKIHCQGWRWFMNLSSPERYY